MEGGGGVRKCRPGRSDRVSQVTSQVTRPSYPTTTTTDNTTHNHDCWSLLSCLVSPAWSASPRPRCLLPVRGLSLSPLPTCPAFRSPPGPLTCPPSPSHSLSVVLSSSRPLALALPLPTLSSLSLFLPRRLPRPLVPSVSLCPTLPLACSPRSSRCVPRPPSLPLLALSPPCPSLALSLTVCPLLVFPSPVLPLRAFPLLPLTRALPLSPILSMPPHSRHSRPPQPLGEWFLVTSGPSWSCPDLWPALLGPRPSSPVLALPPCPHLHSPPLLALPV